MVAKRIDRNEARLKASPSDTAALKALVRDNYSQAVSQQPSGATEFPDDAKDDLAHAATYWQRYLKPRRTSRTPRWPPWRCACTTSAP